MKTSMRIFAVLLALLMCFSLCACENKTQDESNVPDDFSLETVNALMSEPAAGEEVAVLHTNMGDIYIRLFEDQAPKAVENFKGLINKKFYDGLIFHRVMNDFMIQGGDPNGDGTGGESLWGSKFEDEFSPNAMNLRGTLAMANSGVNTNGSQFFINQANPTATASQLKNRAIASARAAGVENATPDPDMVPDEVWDLYAQKGGNMHLDGAYRHSGGHTVFGYVYKGMDVVDAIAQVQTNSNDKPLKDVVITSAEIIKA